MVPLAVLLCCGFAVGGGALFLATRRGGGDAQPNMEMYERPRHEGEKTKAAWSSEVSYDSGSDGGSDSSGGGKAKRSSKEEAVLPPPPYQPDKAAEAFSPSAPPPQIAYKPAKQPFEAWSESTAEASETESSTASPRA